MKRLISLLFTLILFGNLNAQKLRYDTKNNEGERHIGLEFLKQKVGKKQYYFSLKIVNFNNQDNYFLIIKSYAPTPDNSQLLIKMKNDDVIILYTNTIDREKFSNTYNIPISSGYNTLNVLYNEHSTLSTAIYPISREDILKIIKYGITKIRIPTEDKHIYNERVWINNKLGIHIHNSYLKSIQLLNKSNENIKSFDKDSF